MAKYVTQNLAAMFISQQPPLTLVYHGGQWYRFSRSAGWCVEGEENVKSRVVKFLWETFNGSQAGGRESVSENRVKDVLLCIQAVLTIPTLHEQGLDPSVFLTFSEGDMTATSAEGWIATRTHLLHVPTVAVALYRGESIPDDAVRPLDSSLFCRGMVPCEFSADAPCPRWEQFLSKVCPEDGQAFEGMMGLAMTYDRRYNVFFVVHGEASTGKSTALGVLASLNKGVTSHVPLSMFGEKFSPYKLTVNRLNLIQDMESVTTHSRNVQLREAVLKSCTCGEMGEVELKFHNLEDRRYTALQVYGCNSLPKFADRSQAIARRLRIFQFPNVFSTPEVRDNSLPEKLHAELSGILLRALRGYGWLLDSGTSVFPESASAERIKAELIKSTRPEELFCDEHLLRVDDENVKLPTEEVYHKYVRFCGDNGFSSEDSNTVIPLMCAYLKTTKKRRQTESGIKTCLLGVRYNDGAVPSPNGRMTKMSDLSFFSGMW